jgi:hypothetical protein
MDTVAAGSIVNMQGYGSGSEFFYPEFIVKKATDPRSGYATENFSIFNPKNITKLSEI